MTTSTDAAITMGMVLLNEAATSKGDVGKRRSEFRFLADFGTEALCAAVTELWSGSKRALVQPASPGQRFP